MTRSNNEDRNKVLATVAFTTIEFMRHHPQAIVFARGSTPSRTRLYQISIQANWLEISKMFSVEGYYHANWEPFKKAKIMKPLPRQLNKKTKFVITKKICMAANNVKKATVPAITIVKKMRNYDNDPFFVKKKEDAIAFLEKHGLPDGKKFRRID